jgi:hypothetical protein
MILDATQVFYPVVLAMAVTVFVVVALLLGEIEGCGRSGRSARDPRE